MDGPNTKYLPAVDHLRLLAALMVLMYHGVGKVVWTRSAMPVPQHWPTLFITEGYSGVSLFMVISGFILAYTAIGKHVSYRRFLHNRALRLLPLLAVVFLLAVVSNPGTISPRLLWIAVIPSKMGSDATLPIAVAWTIFVEIELYVMFPVLLRHLEEGGPRRLLGVVALLAGFRFVALSHGVNQFDVLYFSVLSRADQFIMGMLAAWVLRRYASRRLILAGPIGFGCSVLLLSLLSHARGNPVLFPSALGHYWRVLSPTAEGLGWACFVLGYVAFMQGRRSLVIRWLAGAGATSYSIYLLHQFIITTLFANNVRLAVGHSLFTEGVATALLIALPLTLIASRLTYHLIELPLLRRRVRWAEEPPRPVPVPLHAERVEATG